MASSKKYRKWSQEDIDLAISEVQTKKISINKAAEKYGIPRSTLKDKVSGKTPVRSTQGPDPVLTKAEEEELVTWCINMARIGYGRTKEQVTTIVQELIKKHPRPNPFKDGKPGREWWSAFLRRNPGASLRSTENLSKERAVSTNEDSIKKWFRDCSQFLEESGNVGVLKDPSRIFNADESGFPLNPKSDDKVLAEVGSRNVYSLSSSDRSQITVLACANAAGYLMPPMFVFPGERFKYNPLFEAVPNTYLGRSKNGWMDHEVFFMWLANHFVKFIPATKPVLLFVDGHATHLDIEVCKFCRDNDIILYCLPPHSSHILQPLDVAFFRPLKRAYRKSVKDYKDANPGQTITRQIFAKVFRPAWENSNKAQTFINGFRDTGLYPFNNQALSQENFAPAAVFYQDPISLTSSNDQPLQEFDSETLNTNSNGNFPTASNSLTEDVSEPNQMHVPNPGLNSVPNVTSSNQSGQITNTASEILSSSSAESVISNKHTISPIFEGIISYPKVCNVPKKRKTALPKALTSDQMFEYLNNKQKEKLENERMKEERKNERERKRKLVEEKKKERREAHEKRKEKRASEKNTKYYKLLKNSCNKCKERDTGNPNNTHEWVGCECGRWFHVKCTDIDLGDVSNLTKEEIIVELAELDWLCDFFELN